MVAAPHCGAGFLSNDITDDEIPSTGGHHRFALTPVYTQHRRRLAAIFKLNKIVIFTFPGLCPVKLKNPPIHVNQRDAYATEILVLWAKGLVRNFEKRVPLRMNRPDHVAERYLLRTLSAFSG